MAIAYTALAWRRVVKIMFI